MSRTRSISLDHAEDSIRANALIPGAIETPLVFAGHSGSGSRPISARAAWIWLAACAETTSKSVFRVD